jgi:hypothetical protein
VQVDGPGGTILKNEVGECAADIKTDAPGRGFVLCRHFLVSCCLPASPFNDKPDRASQLSKLGIVRSRVVQFGRSRAWLVKRQPSQADTPPGRA